MPDDRIIALRHRIDELARARVPLRRIEEDVILHAPLDAEHRSALWLHAWHETDGAYHPRADPAAERPPVYAS